MNEALLSDVGQRIGWMLVHSVWQFALIAMVLAIGLRLLRERSPHFHYGLMLATLLVMAVAPVATLFIVESAVVSRDEFVASVRTDTTSKDTLPGSVVSAAREPSVFALNHDIPDGLRRYANKLSQLQTAENLICEWMNVILAGWLFGMLVLSIRPLVGWRATRTLRSRGRTSVSSHIANTTARVAERLQVRRAVKVAQSSRVDVPTVIGWLKPLVLLPASAISGLTTEQFEAVIAHELAHVRRHDYLVNLFQLVMETVFFYHPAVWWVSHRMRIEREECCDDIAVHMTGDRVGYARLLVWLEESRNRSATPTLGMSSGGGSLLGRVRRVVSAPSQTTGTGPLAIAAILTFLVGVGCLLAINANDSRAQESAKSPSDPAAIRSWMARAIEVEEWGRMAGLAKLLAEEGEYEEAIDWLSKAPLGKSREGKLDPKFYFKVVGEICEIALMQDRLDVAEGVLDRLTDPEKRTLSSKSFPPRVGDIRIAILKDHISKGRIDEAIGFLNSQPSGTQTGTVFKAVPRAARLGHGDQVEAFWRQLTDPKCRYVCERELANTYYRLGEPAKIWRLADEIARTQPDDLIAEVRIRNVAMLWYAQMAWERFEERLPRYRKQIGQLPEADRVRYAKKLALMAAKSQHYELAVELSSSVPLLTLDMIRGWDLSGTDRHPVLYAITELQKQRKFDQALALIDLVEDDAVELASLARLADRTGFGGDDAVNQQVYQRIVNRLTQSYQKFSLKNDELTVRGTSERLPEMMNLHLRRMTNPLLPPHDVRYLNQDLLLTTSSHFDVLIEQGKINEIEKHIERLIKDGNLSGAKWIVAKLATAGQTEFYERLLVRFNQAVDAQKSSKANSKITKLSETTFLTRTARSAYAAGQRDLCYDTFMKLEPLWKNTAMKSQTATQIAFKARESGDIAFLRRMESSPSRLMRRAALVSLAVHHVQSGDAEAATQAAVTFDREFGPTSVSWSIYRSITDQRVVKDPSQRIVATQIALQQVPIESKDYARIARDHAKLLGQLYPDKPLPADWLAQFNSDPKLTLQVELEHASGSRSVEEADTRAATESTVDKAASETKSSDKPKNILTVKVLSAANGGLIANAYLTLWRALEPSETEPVNTVNGAQGFGYYDPVIWDDRQHNARWVRAANAHPNDGRHSKDGVDAYHFKSLSAGRYRVTVMSYDRTAATPDPTPYGASEPITVDGTTPATINVNLVGGDSDLTIQVVDSKTREPIENLALRLKTTGGMPIVHGHGSGNFFERTSDQGEVRFAQLLSGDFLVEIIGKHARVNQFVEYLPLDDPMAIQVQPGKQKIEVAVQPRLLTQAGIEQSFPFSAFGRVTDTDGNPMANVIVRAATGRGTLRGGGQTKTDAEGKYRLYFGPGVRRQISDDAPQGVGIQAAHFYVDKASWKVDTPDGYLFYLMSDGTRAKFMELLDQQNGKYWGKTTADEVVFAGESREINIVLKRDE